MLWLKTSESLPNISKDTFLDVLYSMNFSLKDIIEYSKKSFICLTNKNSVVKILNPRTAKLHTLNWIAADKLFTQFHIKTPKILKVVEFNNFYAIETEYIELNKINTKKESDKIFTEIFSRLINNHQFNKFGFISTEINVPATKKVLYINYWKSQWDYYNTKIKNSMQKSPLNFRKYCHLVSKLTEPSKFILSHTDISPKHIFGDVKNPGVIDINETMYVDTSFMLALWSIRSSSIDKIGIHQIIKNFNIDINWTLFHLYRELAIQLYYEKKLSDFETMYSQKVDLLLPLYN